MSKTGGAGSSSAAAAEGELRRLKEAIVDLYLAIKIRSTEEVSLILSKYWFQNVVGLDK
jgi:hypothetical protein